MLKPSERSESNLSDYQVPCASQNGRVRGGCAADCDYHPRSYGLRSSNNGFTGCVLDGSRFRYERDSRRVGVQIAVASDTKRRTNSDVLDWHFVPSSRRNAVGAPVAAAMLSQSKSVMAIFQQLHG